MQINLIKINNETCGEFLNEMHKGNLNELNRAYMPSYPTFNQNKNRCCIGSKRLDNFLKGFPSMCSNEMSFYFHL